MAEGCPNKTPPVLKFKPLASDIIAAQETEIAEMQGVAGKPGIPMLRQTPVMYHAEMGHMMPMSEDMMSAMMMDMDLGTADG